MNMRKPFFRRICFLALLAVFGAGGSVHLLARDPLPEDSVGIRGFTTRAAQTGEIPITQVPIFIQNSGYYILMNDVSCDSSAIGIKANNVTLDLNGHTITYGNGIKQNTGVATYNSIQSGNVGHCAIACPTDPRMCPDFAFGWNAAFTGCIIKNGRIKSGTGAGLSYSPAVSVDGLSGAEIENLEIEQDGDDSEALIAGPNARIRYCTFNQTTDKVTNRHQIMSCISLAKQGAEVSYCRIKDAAQTGIKPNGRYAPNCIIHHNFIQLAVCPSATNGYGVGVYAANLKVHNNKIINADGRGLHIGGTFDSVYSNYLEIRNYPNAEYTRMEEHGIKIEGGTNAVIFGNEVVCVSVPNGRPTPLNMDIADTSQNRVFGNTFVALSTLPIAQDQNCWSAFLIASDGKTAEICNNTFFAYAGSGCQAYCVGIPWDGANNHTFRECAFRRLSQQTGTVNFIEVVPNVLSSNIRFVDCNYYNGISPRTNKVRANVGADWTVGWTFELQTIAGATIDIRDKTGVLAKSGTTDGNGKYTTELDEFVAMVAAGASAAILNDFAPYTVKISGGGNSRELRVMAKSPMECVLPSLEGNAPIILTPSSPVKGEMNMEYSLELSATGTAATSWAIASGTLPVGLVLSNGVISGTPVTVGTSPITVQANADGNTSTKQISITILPEKANFWKERVAMLTGSSWINQPEFDGNKIITSSSMDLLPKTFSSGVSFTCFVPQSGAYLFTVYNVMGQRLWEQPFHASTAGNYPLRWSRTRATKGIYLATLEGNSFQMAKRFLR